MNFYEPELMQDGKPYKPNRFREIVKEQYIITKNLNTSFIDTEMITPQERSLLLKFIIEDNEKNSQNFKEMMEKKNNKK